MRALDTNILVRFLVKDDEQQAAAVYALFKQTEADKEVLFVPMLVVLETIWVLGSVYEIPEHEILAAFSELLLMPTLMFEAQPAIQDFIFSARQSTVDLADILIGCSAKSSDCVNILTFDKKASKLAFFELIE